MGSVGTADSAAAAGSLGTDASYGFASDDQPVAGATSTADAELLAPGKTYKSSLPAGRDAVYRLELDAVSDAYVSVTAVPRPNTTVTAYDGIRVTVQDANSRTCSTESASVGAGRSARPVVAWGKRETFLRRTSCQGDGSYYVIVHRIAGTGPVQDDWDLELAPFLEPRLEKAAGTAPPESWDSASPEPPTGAAAPRPGGPGFGAAVGLEPGVWSAGISPGQTLFYAVPVGWGQRIDATAELGGTGRGPFVGGALTMSLYNPARGPVDDVSIGYSGSQKSGSLDSLPPVGYANRYAVSDTVNGMRFAGSYYLVLHLAERVGEEFGTEPFAVTFRVGVDGAAEAGPVYDGRFQPPGPFEAAGRGQQAQGRGAGAAGGGGAGGAAGGDPVMTVVAVVGIGGGTVLLAVLGVWTVVARRRARGAW
ncbi:hypothetical protein [Streptomyces sp. Act143]|uniref:hypothetical protein n=1 Tax=Streptomyces sp. Act143 TaxID=2200760 RepID=UPI00215A48D8|nr:hypothetical protein [Streptomyces sp. Act143]